MFILYAAKNNETPKRILSSKSKIGLISLFHNLEKAEIWPEDHDAIVICNNTNRQWILDDTLEKISSQDYITI